MKMILKRNYSKKAGIYAGFFTNKLFLCRKYKIIHEFEI